MGVDDQSGETSTERFQRIFAASRMPTAVLSANARYFTEANHAFCEMFGYSEAELLWLTLFDLTVVEDRPGELALWEQIVAGNLDSYEMEKRMSHRDGTIIWVSVSVTAFLDSAGSAEYVVATVEDIAQRKRAKEELLRAETEVLSAQKAESLRELASGIAHDFNNLLVGIVGNTELARARLPDDDTARELLDEVLGSAETAVDLIRQMLAYSGGGVVELRPIDLRESVTSALKQIGRGRASVKVTRELGGVAVIADRVQLSQLVVNLVSNALEAYGDRSGAVQVRVRERPITSAEWERAVVLPTEGHGDDWACLEVTDQGDGMTSREVTWAFGPFASTKGPGRGLGLPAVMGIVRGHRGLLSVRSALGEGTTILVAFEPTSAEISQATRLPSARGEDMEHESLRILVVDDEPIVTRLVGRVLEGAGHQVEILASATTGLQRIAGMDGTVDLVLTDLSLPDATGLTLAKAATALGIPVVVTVGSPKGRVFADLPPAAQVLRKPFMPDDLLKAVVRSTAKR